MALRRLASSQSTSKFLLPLLVGVAALAAEGCSDDSAVPAAGGGTSAVGGNQNSGGVGGASSPNGGSPPASAGGSPAGGATSAGIGGNQSTATGGIGTAGAPMGTGGAAQGGVGAGSGGMQSAAGAAGANMASGGMASGGTAGGGAGAAGGPPIVDLFNAKDLAGFKAYEEPSRELTATEALQIFKVEDGAIRVYGDAANQSTQARHTLVTSASYGKYNLWLEYKWGTKTFAPYADVTRYPRDAGILFHLHGDTKAVWPSSIEFQIKDGTSGDIFALYARCTSLGKSGGTTFAEAEAGGTEKLVDGSNGFVQHSRSANFEVAGWNALLLEVVGGSAVYSVNGHIVNKVLSVMDKTGKAVTSGPIAFQAEHAEVFYRNIRIQVLQ